MSSIIINTVLFILICFKFCSKHFFNHVLEKINNDLFREGLSRFLLGMTVHLSQDVVSATMAHLLICQNGTRFTFSHSFKDLLVGQMLNHLNGKDPGHFVLKRNNVNKNNETDMWPDYSVNDYIYRDESLENVSFYLFGIKYEKKYFTFKQMKKRNLEGLPLLQPEEGMYFQEGHPGRFYCYLTWAKKDYIPRISAPKKMICDLELLELETEDIECDEPSESALDMREDYAKYALILFYPFRGDELFTLSNTNYTSLWDKFMRVSDPENLESCFWKEGNQILQYTQDRIQSTKTRLPADELESKTEQRKVDRSNGFSHTAYSNEDIEWDDASSVGEYEDNDSEDFLQFTSENSNAKTRYLDDLKKGRKMDAQDVIQPRLSSGCNSLFQESRNQQIQTNNDLSFQNDHQSSDTNFRDYGTLLAFVSGASVGSKSNSIFCDLENKGE